MKRKGSPQSAPAPEKKEKKNCKKNEILWEDVFAKYPTLDRSFKERIRNVERVEGVWYEPEASGPHPCDIDDDEECLMEWDGYSFEFERINKKGAKVWTKFLIRGGRGGDDCVLWECRYISVPFGVLTDMGNRELENLIQEEKIAPSDEWKVAANIVRAFVF